MYIQGMSFNKIIFLVLHQGHFKGKAVFFFNCECIAVKIGLSTSTTMLIPTRASSFTYYGFSTISANANSEKEVINILVLL